MHVMWSLAWVVLALDLLRKPSFLLSHGLASNNARDVTMHKVILVHFTAHRWKLNTVQKFGGN